MKFTPATSNARFRFQKALTVGGSNAAYGAADYIAQGIVMLVAARFLVHRLGLSQYGIWMLAMAISNAMETLSSGFGDATIKFVSKYRGLQDKRNVGRIIRAALAINGGLGVLLAASVISLARFTATDIFHIVQRELPMTIRMLQVAGLVMLVRSIENVYANALRAYEQYGKTVKVTVSMRVLTVTAAIVLAFMGRSALSIMLETLFFSCLSVILQVGILCEICGELIIMPRIDRNSIKEMFSFGIFSWVQALAAVIFYNADRLIVGSILGPSALGIYAVCVQATQPIHGIAAASLNFIFPYASARDEAGERDGVRKIAQTAIAINIGLVVLLAAPLIVFSRFILILWMGTEFARQARVVLIWLAVANACLGASVAAHYLLLARGKVRFVSLVNVLGGIASLLTIAYLIPHFGLPGAALGKLAYSAATALNFWKLRKALA